MTKIAKDMARWEKQEIIGDEIRKTLLMPLSDAIKKSLIGQTEMIVEDTDTRLNIIAKAHRVISEEFDPSNIEKRDRPLDARSLIADLLRGKAGGQPINKFADDAGTVRKVGKGKVNQDTGDDIQKRGDGEPVTVHSAIKKSQKSPQRYPR
jgi:hypothetical protein